MANEITAIESNRDASGAVRIQLFMIFPITAKVVGGSNVVPTPANEGANAANPSLLPEIVDRVILAAERTTLNGGTAVFKLASFVKLVGMTNPQLVTRAREIYAAFNATIQTDLDERFEFSGSRINSV